MPRALPLLLLLLPLSSHCQDFEESPFPLSFPTLFQFHHFLNRPHLNLVGDARTELRELVLSGPGRARTGAVWFSNAVDPSKGFKCEFTLSVSQVDNHGGEGVAFVVQKDGPYALGRAGDGMGYAGVGEGVAVEFDGKRDVGQERSKEEMDLGAHVSIRTALKPGAKLNSDHELDFMKVVPIPNLAQFYRPIDVRVEYFPPPDDGKFNALGELVVSFNIGKKGHPARFVVGAKTTVGTFFGGNAYWVGFTSSTGDTSAARFSLVRWKMSVIGVEKCAHGFSGPDCTVSEEESHKECPRRETCLGCVKDVYNCAWCNKGKTIKSGGQCISGALLASFGCEGDVVEELGCAAPLSLIWLWLILGIVGVVLVFGFVLVRTLPKNQAFRSVAMLVSLACGAIFGMLLSYVVAACLVEISSSPFFSFGFGAFLFYLSFLISSEVRSVKGLGYRWTWDVVVSVVAAIWIAFSGLLCFLLDKKLVMWLPEWLKIIMYAMLASALTFCVVFSSMDFANEAYERYTKRETNTPGLAEMMDTQKRRDILSYGPVAAQIDDEMGAGVGQARVLIIAKNKARYGLLIMASLISGVYFGIVFGLMRIEEESIYRASLLLKQESAFTFPAGALVGGICGLLLQFLTTSPHSDVEIDRIISEAKDDL